MRSIEDIYLDIRNDPKKLARAFKIIWIVSYSMLILGFLLIVWVLFDQRFT